MISTAHPSPNCGPRKGSAVADMVVLHYTAMETAQAALDRLCDPTYEVSAHYLISETGDVFALVDEALRAWHAGAGQWGSVTDVNSRSIGIELANTGVTPFSAGQMDALEELLRGIMARWAIRPERIIGHSDMAPARKIDPGVRFDWKRLALAGLSVWPDGQGAIDGCFDDLAQQFGYPAGEDTLAAFRMRFRPWATGPLDDDDLMVITNLATRFPVDHVPLTS